MKVIKNFMIFCVTIFLIFSFPSKAPASQEVGLTQNEIVLGGTYPQSGATAPFFQDFYQGAQAYFQYLNSKGGIYGRKIKLVLKDDRNIPALAVSQTASLVLQDKVFALFGSAPYTPSHIAMVKGAGINQRLIPNLEVMADYSLFADASKFPTTFLTNGTQMQEAKFLINFLEQTFPTFPFSASYFSGDTGLDFESVLSTSTKKILRIGSPNGAGCAEAPFPTDNQGILSLTNVLCSPQIPTGLTKSENFPLIIRGKSISSSAGEVLVESSNSKNIFANFSFPQFTESQDPYISFYTKVFKEFLPNRNFSTPFVDSSKSAYNNISQQLYEGANSAYVVAQAIAAIGPQPTRANLINFLRKKSSSLSTASFSRINYSDSANNGDLIQYIAKFDGNKWVKVSDFYAVNSAATSIRSVIPERKPLLPDGLPIMNNTQTTSSRITCINGKTVKVISGVNPTCPKGYKQK